MPFYLSSGFGISLIALNFSYIFSNLDHDFPGMIYRIRPGKELRPYYNKREELSLENGIILWGLRVVLPVKYQVQIMKELLKGLNRT